MPSTARRFSLSLKKVDSLYAGQPFPHLDPPHFSFLTPPPPSTIMESQLEAELSLSNRSLTVRDNYPYRLRVSATPKMFRTRNNSDPNMLISGFGMSRIRTLASPCTSSDSQRSLFFKDNDRGNPARFALEHPRQSLNRRSARKTARTSKEVREYCFSELRLRDSDGDGYNYHFYYYYDDDPRRTPLQAGSCC